MKNTLTCTNCGKTFESKYFPMTCSDKCKRERRNRNARESRRIRHEITDFIKAARQA